jgi:3-phosphoshikimate 1-carboxyvinyltransferase
VNRKFPPYLDLGPFARAAGTVRLPGSKSISNRVLLLAALADGHTEIGNLLVADDVERMCDALTELGVPISRDADAVRVRGCAGRFPNLEADLFLGNAGTAFRPLTAALALNGGHYRLSGVARMHERPIGDLVDALAGVGADIRYAAKAGYPPLEIFPGTLRRGEPVRVSGSVSSQFLTALLMALPMTGAEQVIEVVGDLISKPYIEITLKLMALFQVQVERHGWSRFIVRAAQRYVSPGRVLVEGDASNASYFLAAGAIGSGPVRVLGAGRDSVQGDVRFVDALAQMGAQVDIGEDWIEVRAPACAKLRAFDLDLNHIPDAAMTLAVAALFADGPCRLRNVASWRVKETDRLKAMATELRKVGAQIEEGSDFLVVTPPAAGFTSGADIATYDDHRMAMCFALVALGQVRVRIDDPGCVAKTFPDFFDRFSAITQEMSADADVPVIAIDGPSASGKGTVARAVAETLGFHFLDSGALYRLVALAAIKQGITWEQTERLTELALALNCRFEGDGVLLDEQDATLAIRAEEVSAGASRVAAIGAVREALLARQRAFRSPPGLVADGRDMGSVVFPDARLKVFLTASAEERARRRYKQLMDKGIRANLGTLLQDISERDARDASRGVAPLQKCADAHLLDTTEISVEQAVSRILAWYRQVLPAPSS